MVVRLPYEHPGTPDLRSPLSFLGWVGRGQWRTLAVATVFGVLWMVTQALFPAAMSRAIDEGIVAGQPQALLLWCGVLVGLGLVSALAGRVAALVRGAQLAAGGVPLDPAGRLAQRRRRRGAPPADADG